MTPHRTTLALTGRRLAVGACLAVLFGLTSACAASSSDEDAVRGVVEQYVGFLEAGEAAAADALDAFDPAATRCPELFTDEVYGTVTDRPTDLRVEDVFVTDNRATVEAVLRLGERPDVAVTLPLVASDDGWLIDNANLGDLLDGVGGVTVWADHAPGEVTVQGACPQAIGTMEMGMLLTSVYPGTWTVGYQDPARIGTAEPVATTVLGTMRRATAPDDAATDPVTITPTPSGGAVAAIDDAVWALAQACAAARTDDGSCPGPPPWATEVPVGDVLLIRTQVTVESARDGAWHVRASVPASWQDQTGAFREIEIPYYLTATIDEAGVAHLTLP